MKEKGRMRGKMVVQKWRKEDKMCDGAKKDNGKDESWEEKPSHAEREKRD